MASISTFLGALMLAASCSSIAMADSGVPTDALVLQSANACVGMAKKYSIDARRFDYDQTRKYISDEVDSCVKVLSWMRFNPEEGASISDKISTDWNRTAFDVNDEQYVFYRDFHMNIMAAAKKAAINEKFRDEMTSLGKNSSLKADLVN